MDIKIFTTGGADAEGWGIFFFDRVNKMYQ